MTNFELIDIIHGSRGVRANVEIYGEKDEDAVVRDPYRSYRATCDCGTQEEGFSEQGAAVRWAERHVDAHADEEAGASIRAFLCNNQPAGPFH